MSLDLGGRFLGACFKTAFMLFFVAKMSILFKTFLET